MSLLLRESQYFLHNHCFILHTKSLNAFRALEIFVAFCHEIMNKRKKKHVPEKTKTIKLNCKWKLKLKIYRMYLSNNDFKVAKFSMQYADWYVH